MMNHSVLDAVTSESCQWFEAEWKFVNLMEILRLYADGYGSKCTPEGSLARSITGRAQGPHPLVFFLAQV